MSYYYDDNSCSRCMRSSPIASLVGVLFVVLGGGALGGGIIFARKYTQEILDYPDLYPYLDYVAYGIMAVIAVFSIVGYLVCAFSSSYNAKVFFEGSMKAFCGRFLTMTFVVFYVCAILLWLLVSCCLAYPVITIGFLIYRHMQMSNTDLTHDLSYYGIYKNSTVIKISDNYFYNQYRDPLISYSVALGGCFLLIIGYIQLAICTAMNFVTLGELRYYDMSDAETVQQETALATC